MLLRSARDGPFRALLPPSGLVRAVLHVHACVTAALDMTLEDCCRLMEGNRVRRIVVVDESGSCCGIVSQADVALRAPEKKTAEVVRVVSQPTTSPA